jgi:hypothetical protein
MKSENNIRERRKNLFQIEGTKKKLDLNILMVSFDERS